MQTQPLARPQRRALNNEPNVIPMIDILLVLLVIFMLGTMVLQRRTFDLQLPDRTEEGSGAPVVLRVQPGPVYVLGGERIPPARIVPRLRDVFAPRPEKVIFVDADRRLRYQEVADAFDAVREAGIRVTGVVLP